MSLVKIEINNKGKNGADFNDSTNRPCVLMESSWADKEPSIFLGVTTHGNISMCLNQSLVKELLPFLTNFVETGKLTT